MKVNTAVSGQGVFAVVANNNNLQTGTVEFKNAVSAGEVVQLNAGLLMLDAPKQFLGSIEDFNSASRIELAHTTADRASFSDGILSLLEGHRLVAKLDLVGNFSSCDFQLSHERGNTFVALRSGGTQVDLGHQPPWNWASLQN